MCQLIMFEAKVYTTAILSLSGMMDETHTARQTVSRFNQQHAASTGRLFLPVDAPQAADVVIGIVDNWDKDTGWVDDCIRQGKHVTLFFSAHQDPNNTLFPVSTVRLKPLERARKAAAGAWRIEMLPS